jgi:plastocyanin
MRYMLAAGLLGIALAAIPAVASEPGLTGMVTAENIGGGGYYEEEHRWSPPQVTVKAGGVVTFSNPTEVKHGVHWIGPPAEPACSGVPVGTTETASGTKWSGTCKFTASGTYTYYCTVHGAKMAGTITVPGTPTATTEQATPTQTGAMLRGAVKPEGNATEYRFEYGTTAVSEHTTSTLSVGSTDFGSHPVSAELTGLAPGTKYRVQLVAIYGEGKTTVPGGEEMFTTLSPTAPTVATGQATVLNETEATLKGTVDPNDGEATEYSFEYGSSPSYGHSTVVASLPTDTLSHAVSASLTGLTPGTEYHFRLVAKNRLGPAEGADNTFKSAPRPTPSEPPSTTATTSTTPTPPPTTTTLAEPPPGPPITGSPSLRAGQRAGQ